MLLLNGNPFICRTYVGCDYCFDWFHPECLGMSDENISAMLSAKTFLCPSCSKFGEMDTMKNAEEEEEEDEEEEEKTTVRSGS